MAKKKDRAFFTCPRWQDVLDASGRTSDAPGDLELSSKTIAAIEGGKPVARSTLRKALFAVRRASGTMFDVDEWIVDRRSSRLRE